MGELQAALSESASVAKPRAAKASTVASAERRRVTTRGGRQRSAYATFPCPRTLTRNIGSAKELSQFKQVMAHPAFQKNPAATIAEHLANASAASRI